MPLGCSVSGSGPTRARGLTPNSSMSQPQIETIAVTGATGFIGRALSRRLVALGFHVRVLVRPPTARTYQPPRGVEVVVGALEDESALERLVSGAHSVVHCAGQVRGTLPGFRATNEEGTRRLARVAARASRPPHVVALSSLAAREPQLSDYAASKRAGETALAAEAGSAPWTILRPPAVYGPGDRELLPLFEWMARGIAPVLGPADARFSLIFVDDLADCIAHLVRAGRGSGRVYEVHDGRRGGYGWDDVLDTVALLSGRRPRRVRIPAALATSIAAANLVARRLFGGAPMFTPGKVRELRHPDWVCDDAALLSVTSWRPEVRLEQGLRRTLFPAPTTPIEVPHAH